MSNETCARQCNISELMREDTDSEVFFQKYTLSEETTARLESIRDMMKDNIAQANPLWKVIAGEVRIAFDLIFNKILMFLRYASFDELWFRRECWKCGAKYLDRKIFSSV